MKKFFLLLVTVAVLTSFISLTSLTSVTNLSYAASPVLKLSDQTLSLPGCKLQGAASSCGVIDGHQLSEVKKTTTISQFIPESGMLTIYFKDKSSPKAPAEAQGGFDPALVFFQPLTSGAKKISIGQGLQVFESGTVSIELTQSYTDQERLPVNADLVLYFLPHSADRQRNFLIWKSTDQKAFDTFQTHNQDDVSALCSTLQGEARLPDICSNGISSGEEASDVSPSWSSDPRKISGLDFQKNAIRPPTMTLKDHEKFVFLHEPLTIKIKEVYDPDGLCHFFRYDWKKDTELQASGMKVDDQLGNLFFVPENTGIFELNVRATELCKNLGTLTSAPAFVRILVRDKATDFPDLAAAKQYQNALWTLVHQGSMKGYSDGTLKPQQQISRAEFLKLVFETVNPGNAPLLSRRGEGGWSPRYTDVPVDSWFAPYVFMADQLGVIKGYPDNLFHPERPINLVEALKIALHFTTIPVMDTEIYSFPDVSNDDWFSRYIQTAFREGIVDLTAKKKALPGAFLTRGRAAEIIVRTFLYPVNRINQVNKDALHRPTEFEDFSSFAR